MRITRTLVYRCALKSLRRWGVKMKQYIITMPGCQKCKMLKAQNPDVDSVELDPLDILNFARAVGIKSLPFIVTVGEPDELHEQLKGNK